MNQQDKISDSWLRRRTVRSAGEAAFLWIAAVAIHVVFIPGMVATLWTSHFLSFVKLDAQPSGHLARFISANMGTFDVIALVSAVLLATTALLRLRARDWKGPVARLCAVALAPMVIETLAYSVQDGTTNDLDVVRVHSVVLLVLCLLLPFVAALFDLWRVRFPKELIVDESRFARSKTIEEYKNRARAASAGRNN